MKTYSHLIIRVSFSFFSFSFPLGSNLDVRETKNGIVTKPTKQEGHNQNSENHRKYKD